MGGLVVGTIGIDTVKHCHRPREVVLASLPLLHLDVPVEQLRAKAERSPGRGVEIPVAW